jgi:selenocysteine-specific elongation factor
VTPTSPVRIVATAGHVDHGKSTLVRALTGVDPDRWAEEKERGLTIDLGFASTRLPSGATVSFVDVPGHTRFLKNMLAGVGAVPAVLFVVAATEGWKPQSEEHLRILELLGVERGVVALTKVDLVDDDDLELAQLELSDHVAGTFLESAEVVPVDATAARETRALAAALDRLVQATPEAVDKGRPRMWVDRSFAVKGAGTVLTGTLTGGTLHVDDEVQVLPAGRTARIRGLQTLHREVDAVGPGHRVAVNMVGVDHHAVRRGDVLVAPGHWHRTSRVDAELHVLAALDHSVSRRGAYGLHVGAAELPVRLRVLGREALKPGSTGAVRLHLPVALPLQPGDRFVLREWGRDETVGGGEFLDVDPVLPAGRARPDRSVDRVVRERGWVDVDHLERLTGERRRPDVGRWAVDPVVLARARADLSGAIDEAGPHGLEVASLDEHARAVLASLDDVVRHDGRARRIGVGSDDTLAAHPWLVALGESPFTPPEPVGVAPADLREMARRGLVTRADDVWFATSALDDAAAIVAGLLTERPEGVTVGEVREALGSTRKYVVPLLTHFDAVGRTRRRGDLRIAGPRLTDR